MDIILKGDGKKMEQLVLSWWSGPRVIADVAGLIHPDHQREVEFMLKPCSSERGRVPVKALLIRER